MASGRAIAGRRALVTGGSRGLGAVIARRLVAEGASVVVTGRDATALATVASEIGASALRCDLADRVDLERLVEAAGDVDLLVSNAALPAAGPIDDFTIAEIDRALDVNLRAPIVLARAAAIAMARRGAGHIVFVSSMAAKTAGPSVGLYSATKAGLRALALALREDLRGTGVGVSVILPGPISGAGMWAETGLRPPPGIRMKPPSAVADAVVRAVVENRAELDVAAPGLWAGAVIAQLWPAVFAALGRRWAGQYADALTSAGRAHR